MPHWLPRNQADAPETLNGFTPSVGQGGGGGRIQWWQVPAGQGPTASKIPCHLRVFSGTGQEAADAKSELLLFLIVNQGQAAGISALESPLQIRPHLPHGQCAAIPLVGAGAVSVLNVSQTPAHWIHLQRGRKELAELLPHTCYYIDHALYAVGTQ